MRAKLCSDADASFVVADFRTATQWLPIPELDMRNNTKDRPHAYFELVRENAALSNE